MCSKMFPGVVLDVIVEICGSGVDRTVRDRFGLISSNVRQKRSTGQPKNAKKQCSSMQVVGWLLRSLLIMGDMCWETV